MVTRALATVGTATHDGNRVEGEFFCQELLYPYGKAEEDALYAFKTSTDPDMMYLHQAMKEPDREQFQEAMLKEVKDQMEKNTSANTVSQQMSQSCQQSGK
jgi:hypothetical protein